mgnify:CR=1 FL=1
MPVREREIESYLRKRVEEHGGVCEKFIPDLDSGMPDRIVMLPGGVLVWVETKKPKGGKVSPIQLYQHGRLRKLGQAVEVGWTKVQADEFIARYAAPRT